MACEWLFDLNLDYHRKSRNNFLCTLSRLEGWASRIMLAHSRCTFLLGNVDEN